MANKVKYGALDAFSTAIAGAAVAPSLKNLANNGQKVGNEIDPTGVGNRFMLSLWELKCRFAAAPSAGGYCELYFVPAIDGANYSDGDDAVAPPLTFFVGTFPVRTVTTQQRVGMPQHIPFPASKFKPLVVNKSGQAMTNTDDENILSYRTYDPEVQ